MKPENYNWKTARRLAILAIAAALAVAPAAEALAAPDAATGPAAPTAPSTAPNTHPNAAMAALLAPVAARVDRIRRAPDPSSAVDAYTAAQAADPNNLEVERAYVYRMVELNAPELADVQARGVALRDP